tara:strand:+ start:1695 stop:1985 length:291 start_codon:yes stop_codon:yes gene_type:complete
MSATRIIKNNPKKTIGLALATGLGVHQVYKAMQDEAEQEFSPVETTLDGLEEYVLDPIGDNVSPGTALTLGGLGLLGIGAHKGYKAYQDVRGPLNR